MSIIVFIIDWIYRILVLLLLARAIISFLPLDRYHPIVMWIYRLTEPLLAPIRRFLPPMGGFDLSPIVLLILLAILRSVLITLLL
jgi:YggT family protein